MRVLIVEDERRLAEALKQIMEEQKYITDVVYNGDDGLAYALSGQYDVIVLDVMLPGKNGFEVVSEMRRQKNAAPVLILTAREAVPDRVKGLDSGADDYMTKPFAPEELLARLRTLARRQGEIILNELSFGDLTLELSTGDLRRGEKSVHLGFKELEVLKILMANPKSITPKEELLEKVWGIASDAEDNNVEAYISFLRKKFRFLGSSAEISVLRKMGYRLAFVSPEGGKES